MKDSEKNNQANLFWRFFSSVKLTIVLLIILALASIIGTLIPQMPQRDIVDFARDLSPGVRKLFFFLDLFDLYHSSWFRILLGCLTLNLIVCSFDRFPRTWKRFRFTPRVDRNKPFENLPPHQAFIIKGDLEKAVVSVNRVLKKRYKKIRQHFSETQHYLYGERGAYAHFGVYLIHLSVLTILIGGLVGSFFGFEAFVHIVEGETVNTVMLRKGNKPLELEFDVRCDQFYVDFYENGSPKEFRSNLTFFIGGAEVEKGIVRVNHPVQFNGISFYQSNYGRIPGNKVRLKVVRSASPPHTTHFELVKDMAQKLPGKEDRFRIIKISPNFMGRMGPAVKVSIRSNEERETSFWVFQERDMLLKQFPGLMQQDPRLNASAFEPYTFYLEGIESKYYTGLQVNRDPGVPLVWMGCFMMVAGFFVTFFTSHRRIWVRLSGEKQAIRIEVAGSATKNPVGLERELEHLSVQLQNNFRTQG